MKKKVVLINYTGRKGSGPWDAYGMSKALMEKGILCVGIFADTVENRTEIKELPFEKLLFIETYGSTRQFLVESLKFPFKHKEKIKKEFEEYDITYIYCPMDTQWEKYISDCFPSAKVMLVSHEPILKKGDNRIIYNIFKRHMKHADIMLVHSHKFVEVVKRIAGKPTYYIPLGKLNFYTGYENKKTLITYPKDKVNYVFFGRIAQNKGLDILAQAYGIVSGKLVEKVSLSVIGNGDFSQYAGLYENLSNVTVINKWIENDEIESIFSGDKLVVVCPYKEGSQSGVVQVAYDYGVPVIVTDVGGFSEQVQNGVTGLVTEVSADSVASAMIKLAEDDSLYRCISENAVALSKELTWETSAERLIAIMEEHR